MDFNTYIFSPPYSYWLLRGMIVTLFISVITSLFSLIFGLIICFFNISKQKYYRIFAKIYIIIFRNIPPVPLLLFLTFGLPTIYYSLTGMPFSRNVTFSMLIMGISLNTSAYLAEIIRSGLKGVPKESIDSAKVLGLSNTTIRFKVLFPQALYICLPSLSTRITHNIKNSSIALVLPLNVNNMEIMGQAGRIAGQTFAWAEPLIAAAIFYMLISFAIKLSVNFHLNKITREKAF